MIVYNSLYLQSNNRECRLKNSVAAVAKTEHIEIGYWRLRCYLENLMFQMEIYEE